MKTRWGWAGPSSAKIEMEVETEWHWMIIGNLIRQLNNNELMWDTSMWWDDYIYG